MHFPRPEILPFPLSPLATPASTFKLKSLTWDRSSVQMNNFVQHRFVACVDADNFGNDFFLEKRGKLGVRARLGCSILLHTRTTLGAPIDKQFSLYG